MQSRSKAESLTVFVIACEVESPPHPSIAKGPIGTRPRVGLSPKSPQQLAGIRIEPPPSEALAIGTMPLATAAAAPPLDPPGE